MVFGGHPEAKASRNAKIYELLAVLQDVKFHKNITRVETPGQLGAIFIQPGIPDPTDLDLSR